MILINSSVWIDYFNSLDTQQTSKLDMLLDVEPLGIGDLILIEILQGFRLDKDYETAKQLLTSLSIFNMLNMESRLNRLIISGICGNEALQ
ncbi:hypothetical protein [Nitrosomonas sp. Nm34]|uniref:hypothetical protein n=1 Tax=Nitrosomonas sp. Nm34 TaxID=1881055 RepID=UPI0008E1ACB7|nr:hypothetical protein [Nitrosomonas sp. Nm34]SFI58537.1 hypothetical protein SAMN05428978_101842 [Nitrosomonas sp. Nm34]